jgi:hypothetical protein
MQIMGMWCGGTDHEDGVASWASLQFDGLNCLLKNDHFAGIGWSLSDQATA